jgi:hypothetical protein
MEPRSDAILRVQVLEDKREFMKKRSIIGCGPLWMVDLI